MTDATSLTTQAAARPPQVGSGAALAAMVPTNIEEAFRLSKALASSGDMVPKHFQGKPEMCMAAILRGMEVGLAPMQALSSIAVINGRATIWGDALKALMLRAGHHIDVEYEGEGDALTAVATLTRGDTGRKIVRTFSIADAKRAGLFGKPGPWQQYTPRMLGARASTFAIRDGAADALMGMNIADDGEGPDAARDITPAAPRRGGVVYQPLAPAAPAPANEVIDAAPHDAAESQAPQRDKADPQRDSEAPLHDISEAAAKLIARLSRKGDIAELQALWSMQTFGADLDNLDDADRAAVTAAYDAMFTKLDGAAA